MFSIAAAALCLVGVNSKQAFVFEGATGDNALRDGGVWQGLYEAFAGGVFEEAGGVTLFVAANKPHTDAQVRQKALDTLQPLYKELQTNAGWACKAAGSDCRPEAMLSQVIVNVWSGRNACAQAANMSSDLEGYDRVSLYLSIPPFAFGEWARLLSRIGTRVSIACMSLARSRLAQACKRQNICASSSQMLAFQKGTSTWWTTGCHSS